MPTKCTSRICVINLIVLATLTVSYALELPPTIPEGPNWDTYWNRSETNTCCSKKQFVYVLDTSACRDFNETEKLYVKNQFLSNYSGHVTFRGNPTLNYNCHGYLFNGAKKWGGDPANWEGPVKPCYMVDNAGPVYRWGPNHSSFAGTDYAYRGKCGANCLADHDSTIYGTHSNRWKQRQ